MQDDNTNQQISNGESENTRQSNEYFDIKEYNLDHQQMVLLVGLARWKWPFIHYQSSTVKGTKPSNSLIFRLPLPRYWIPDGAMVLQLHKLQISTHLNELSKSNHTPTGKALPLCKSHGEQNLPQPKASGTQNVSQHQHATIEIAKLYMDAIVSMKPPWTILSDILYLMVEYSWKCTIEAQNRPQALAVTSVCTPWVCPLLSGLSLKRDLQTRQAVSLGFCLTPLYQIQDIDNTAKYTYLKHKVSTVWAHLGDRSNWTVVHIYQLD